MAFQGYYNFCRTILTKIETDGLHTRYKSKGAVPKADVTALGTAPRCVVRITYKMGTIVVRKGD
jgi:hypothetical protein